MTYYNQIYNHSCENMEELPDQSIHLIITSPPYNVGLEYEQGQTKEQYYAMLRNVWQECCRVLVPGGRLCINIANTGQKPYIPLTIYISQQLLDLNLLPRGEIIWNKGISAGVSQAWGSWKSPSNPYLRDAHENILVFSKDQYGREKTNREATITKNEFAVYTRTVWNLTAETSTRKHHPAPFPVALPYRLIQLYSFKGDTILDPFMGSGTTAIASIETGRKYVGYELSRTYTEYAQRRINATTLTLFGA